MALAPLAAASFNSVRRCLSTFSVRPPFSPHLLRIFFPPCSKSAAHFAELGWLRVKPIIADMTMTGYCHATTPDLARDTGQNDPACGPAPVSGAAGSSLFARPGVLPTRNAAFSDGLLRSAA